MYAQLKPTYPGRNPRGPSHTPEAPAAAYIRDGRHQAQKQKEKKNSQDAMAASSRLSARLRGLPSDGTRTLLAYCPKPVRSGCT